MIPIKLRLKERSERGWRLRQKAEARSLKELDKTLSRWSGKKFSLSKYFRHPPNISKISYLRDYHRRSTKKPFDDEWDQIHIWVKI